MPDLELLDENLRTAPVRTSVKKAFIRSYGCQMNVYDSGRMGDLLEREGYSEAAGQDDADLVILNTCHIREKASEKVFSELGRLREIKEARKAAGQSFDIVVAGCVAQAEGSEILRRQPAVDLVIGPQNYHRLPELLARQNKRGGIVDTEFPVESKFDEMPAPSAERTALRGVSAFVTVQEGCDKFCTFCVVPYTRGAEVSRPPESILEEVRNLARGSVREITLIGQNVNAYAARAQDGMQYDFARLIRDVASIEMISRVRYTTSHPREMNDALIEAHADVPELMPYLHLPLQSGSDRILAAMNRGHTIDDYLRVVAKLRAKRPDIALSSDFIVGFPGETDSDFEQTLEAIRRIGFAAAYFFKYSSRAGTPAAALDGQVREDVKSLRLARLQQLVDAQRREFNESLVGKKVQILFEKHGRHPGQITGKTPYLQTVQVDAGPALIGECREVEIVKAGTNTLFGQLTRPAGSHG